MGTNSTTKPLPIHAVGAGPSRPALAAPGRNQQIRLADGRRLGFDERGPLDGRPLFYFHGSPSSRLEAALYISDALLDALQIRLIAVDRPGFGLSDFQPGRRLLDWPQDVLDLADALRIEHFAILAYSLGGPYGLACARWIPHRLGRVGILSGTALFSEPGLMADINAGTRRFLSLPRENPRAARLFLWIMLRWLPRLAPTLFTRQAAALLPEPDRAVVLGDARFRQGFVRMVREATHQGVSGAFHDSLLTVSDPGFHLPEIRIPIWLWHGEADQNIPVGMARYAAQVLPAVAAEFYPGEGHLSLFRKHAQMILSALVE